MKLVITGASGFLGRQLVPILRREGVEILLVGRDPQTLSDSFPGIRTSNYDNLADVMNGYSALLHLAARNNDQLGSLQDFRRVNVTLLQTVMEASVLAKVGTFINVTSLQAQIENGSSAYAQSKAEGDAYLAAQSGINIVNLRLPAVYGTEYCGKLAVLNRLPATLRPAAFQILAALKPTVHIDRVAAAVLNAMAGQFQGTQIVSDRQAGNLVFAALKRTIDISFALIVIIFLWWMLLGVWIAIRFSSPGAAIFAQERVGRRQKVFFCYKFRTMYTGTRQVGTHEMSASSITRVGAILRKTKIDELPQILNLLRGELSLVGPRPGLPVQKDLTTARASYDVFDVLPGITGWAQIQGVDMSEPDLLARIDADYIARRSMLMDLKIIIATAVGRGQGDKVKA